MSTNQPFTAQASAYGISVTATASTSQALPSIGNVIRLVNEGPNNCYVSIGTTAQTATVPGTGLANKTVTSTPILAGSDVTFCVPSTTTALNISAICRSSATATLIVQCGEGL